jgi:hypothetical protein
MKLADGPGDRWSRVIGTGGKSGHRRRRLARAGDEIRATRLVTPGDGHAGSAAKWSYTLRRCGVELSSARCGSVTESATENIPPAAQHGGIAQGNLRDVFEKSGLMARAKLNRLARVKRWGKSPPLRWQHRGHGKPRVVQGQIGGESRPGSLSNFAKANALPLRQRKPSQRRTLG